MIFKVPIALKLDHDELRAELDIALSEPGPIGEAARQLARIVLPHMAMEEKFAFPLLGLLPQLAAGEVDAEMATVLPLITRFTESHNALRAEHQETSSKLEKLLEAAQNEGSVKYTQFAYRGMVHEKTEEEVLYPAIYVMGKYIRLALKV